MCIGKRSRESSVQVKTYRSVLVDGFGRVRRNVINDSIMFAEPIIHAFYTHSLCVMCLWSSWLERSPLFKQLFTRCIPPLQVSCLDRVVVRAVDSKSLELSIPGSNPASAFDAGGYGSI